MPYLYMIVQAGIQCSLTFISYYSLLVYHIYNGSFCLWATAHQPNEQKHLLLSYNCPEKELTSQMNHSKWGGNTLETPHIQTQVQNSQPFVFVAIQSTRSDLKTAASVRIDHFILSAGSRSNVLLHCITEFSGCPHCKHHVKISTNYGELKVYF